MAAQPQSTGKEYVVNLEQGRRDSGGSESSIKGVILDVDGTLLLSGDSIR